MSLTSTRQLDLAELKSAYARNENITRLMREVYGQDTNAQISILTAYDLQAGSYVASLEDAHFRDYVAAYGAKLAGLLDALAPTSLLEAGTGEATTLLSAAERMTCACPSILGFDLSWSRIHVARRHWKANTAREATLFVGELESIALPDNAVDVVFTSHAIEPNHGREREILRELYRVTQRYLVLLEPAYELASAEARARMEYHGYCRGLRDIAEEFGWQVKTHELFGVTANPLNPTGLLLIEKSETAIPAEVLPFACPSCRHALTFFEGNYFCDHEGLVFPVLRDIPCLSRSNSIIASQYLRV
jgi:SAM-dependent methyltransferase